MPVSQHASSQHAYSIICVMWPAMLWVHASMMTSCCGQVLVGIAEDLGHVHFMFVFMDQDQAAGYDDSINFSCKLPVRVEE